MQPMLKNQNTKVGDTFVDEMWEPVLGTWGATFEVTNIQVCDPTYTVYTIVFKANGNVTACSGEARGRKL